MKDDPKKEDNKRHTMSHPPDHIPDLDSPKEPRSPIKKETKDRVSNKLIYINLTRFSPQILYTNLTETAIINLYLILILRVRIPSQNRTNFLKNSWKKKLSIWNLETFYESLNENRALVQLQCHLKVQLKEITKRVDWFLRKRLMSQFSNKKKHFVC